MFLTRRAAKRPEWLEVSKTVKGRGAGDDVSEDCVGAIKSIVRPPVLEWKKWEAIKGF